MEMFVVDDLGAGRALIDHLVFVPAVCLCKEVATAVKPFEVFDILGSVSAPCGTTTGEAPAGYYALDRFQQYPPPGVVIWT